MAEKQKQQNMEPIAEPYIIIAQQNWYDDLGSNARNLAMGFSKTHRVLYVNPPLDVNTILKHGIKKHTRQRIRQTFSSQKNTVNVCENIWVHTPSTICLSINWLRNEALFNKLNQSNAFAFFKDIKKALKLLGWLPSECTVFNDSQMFAGMHINRFLNPSQNFYYIRDNLVHHPYFKRHGSRIEPITIKNANAVFANSAYLADYAKHYNNNSLDIGQGCELEVYNPHHLHQEPDDMKDIPHPRIGYIGFLTGERLDIKLLEDLASKTKKWQWVLIGPEEIMFQQSKLHKMENVHFLGPKKPDTLPAYLHYIDVSINPQLVNELTVGNYPRKIDEYLAMGKPVVATDTPAMKMFLPHVHLALGTEAYIIAIENALKEHTKEKAKAAMAIAKSHTWENCVNKIYKKQTEILNA